MVNNMLNPKILLITEDVKEATNISRYLSLKGYPVKIMNLGKEALKTDYLLNYDLIFVDIDNDYEIDILNALKDVGRVQLLIMSTVEDGLNDLPENCIGVGKPVNDTTLKYAFELAVNKHKMEKSLHESDERYKLLIENAEDPIAVINSDGTFLLVNPSGAAYFGKDPDEIIGKRMWDIFQGKYANSQMKSIGSVIESGESVVVEQKTLINNQEKWFSTMIQPLKKFDGTISSVQIIARDITQQKNIEYDLLERENFFYGTLNDMHTFVAVLKPSGEVIFINNTPLERMGLNLEDFEGVMFHETPCWSYSEEVMASIKRDIELCASGKTIGHEVQMKTLDGLLWIDYSMHPVFDINGKVKYLVPEGRDISRIKRAKKALQLEKNRLMSITENSPFGIVLIDKNGFYKYINPKFREMFGYDLKDIPNGREWFKKAFPDPEKRHEAILTWKNDFKNALPAEKKPRTFEISCKNNEKKIIHFSPVMLDNNEYLMTVEDVTERKIAEHALQQSEERFRTVASSAVDAIIITDVDGNIVFCNDSLQRIFGYNEKEILGKSVNMLMPVRYKDEFVRKQERFKLTGRHTLSGKLFESYGYRKDGSEFPIEISITAWEVGGERFTTSIIRDRTERKLVEYELKGSEEKFRQMAENIEEVFWIIDSKMSQLLYISPAYQKVWGCSRESLFDNPRSWIESIHPEDRKQVIDTIFRTPFEIRAESKGIEYRIKRPDGSIRWIWGKAFPLSNGDKKIQRIAGIAIDITRRKMAEMNYSNLFENINVGVYRSTLGSNGKILESNPALLDMFGYKLSEIKAIKSSFLFHDSHDALEFENKIKKFGQVKNEEMKFKKKNGTLFTALISAFTINDDSGEVIYYESVVEDISKYKDLERNEKIKNPVTLSKHYED